MNIFIINSKMSDGDDNYIEIEEDEEGGDNQV